MTNISSITQDVTSFTQLTRAEQRAEVAVARLIVQETLDAIGLGDQAGGVKIEMSTRLTSTMGKARSFDLGNKRAPKGKAQGVALHGRIRLSASPLWRRASPAKRRNTVIHELAHLVANWRIGKSAHHGRHWKAEMRRMGESPVRCHSVPVVRTKRNRPAFAKVDGELLAFAIARGAQGRAAADAPKRMTRADAVATFAVGEVIMFGKPRGEKTRARVEKINKTRLGVRTLEPRGRGGRYRAGTYFTASFALCHKLEG